MLSVVFKIREAEQLSILYPWINTKVTIRLFCLIVTTPLVLMQVHHKNQCIKGWNRILSLPKTPITIACLITSTIGFPDKSTTQVYKKKRKKSAFGGHTY